MTRVNSIICYWTSVGRTPLEDEQMVLVQPYIRFSVEYTVSNISLGSITSRCLQTGPERAAEIEPNIGRTRPFFNTINAYSNDVHLRESWM